jgi:lysophospholipase L1-like esterase
MTEHLLFVSGWRRLSRVAQLLVLAFAVLLGGCARQHTAAEPRLTGAPAGRPATVSDSPTAITKPDVETSSSPLGGVIKPKLPSIFVAGDSTAAKGSGQVQGWAVPFAEYFDPSKVSVVNRARGGRSSRTFITEGLWDQLLADLEPGDIVLIQFGHNDAGQINDASRARGSLPGTGDDTQEIDNLLTKKHEVVHSFGWYLRKMVSDTRAKGATPILMSLTLRNEWRSGQIERGSGRFGQWSSEVAKATGTDFIDLTSVMAEQFNAMGQQKVASLYPQDHTHFNAEGADLHAAGVVSGLKSLPSNPVGALLSTKGLKCPAINATAR